LSYEALAHFTLRIEQLALPEIQETGVKVEVPEKSVPVFRASKEMGKRLNPAAPMPSTRDGALGFTSK
jgi:nucleoid DNA-binding protein